MEAVKYFERIEWADRVINSRLRELERLRVLAENLSPAKLSKDRIQTQPRHDKLEETMAKVIDLEMEIRKKIDCLVDLMRDAKYKIEGIGNPRYETVLREKHINLKTFEEVSECIEMSMTRTKEIYGEAMAEFERKYL